MNIWSSSVTINVPSTPGCSWWMFLLNSTVWMEFPERNESTLTAVNSCFLEYKCSLWNSNRSKYISIFCVYTVELYTCIHISYTAGISRKIETKRSPLYIKTAFVTFRPWRLLLSHKKRI